MSRAIAVRSVLPFLISVVMVIGGLTIGFIYGVDAVAALVDPAFGLLMSEGWWRRAAVALIAWPVGLTLGVAVGYQVGFLLSLPLLDRLALAVERHDGWTVEGRSLGLGNSAFCVSVVMASWLVGSLVFMVLGLLPGVGVVFVAMGWLWSALCVALDALDPSLTRAGYGLGARLRLVRRHLPPVLAFGALASLWIVIPGSYPGIVVGGSRLAARLLKSEATDPAHGSRPATGADGGR